MTMIIDRILWRKELRRAATGLVGREENGSASRRAARLRRVSGYFGTMIEAIANAKLRRMERELELRGIRFDRPNNNWVVRKSQPAERS